MVRPQGIWAASNLTAAPAPLCSFDCPFSWPICRDILCPWNSRAFVFCLFTAYSLCWTARWSYQPDASECLSPFQISWLIIKSIMDLATLLNQPVRLQQSTWSESCHSRKFPQSAPQISWERGLEGIGRLPILQADSVLEKHFPECIPQTVGRDTPHERGSEIQYCWLHCWE